MIYKGTWYHEGVPALHNSYVVETYGSPGGHAAMRPGRINPERWFRVKGRQLEVCHSTGQIMRHWAEKMTPQERLDWYAWADGRMFDTRDGSYIPLPGGGSYYHCTHHAFCANLSWLDSPPDFPPLIAVYEHTLLMHPTLRYGRYWYRAWWPAVIAPYSTLSLQQIHPLATQKPYDRKWTRQVYSISPWPIMDNQWHFFNFALAWKPWDWQELSILHHYYACPGHKWTTIPCESGWPFPP